MNIKYFHQLRSCHLPGFSLIELALVLIIIGILAGAIFKGQDVLAAAKFRSVLTEINRIRTAAILYYDTFGQWPGNDPLAKSRFGESVQNGQGNSILSGDEYHQFWLHLSNAGFISEATPPSSKLGGQFSVEGNFEARKNFLVLSQTDGSGVLTPKQAAALKAKAGENDPLTGQIHILEGKGSTLGSCIQNRTYNLKINTPTCILRVELD